MILYLPHIQGSLFSAVTGIFLPSGLNYDTGLEDLILAVILCLWESVKTLWESVSPLCPVTLHQNQNIFFIIISCFDLGPFELK